MFHQDFYPNGGREQPGCLENKLQIGCNHIRSILLFTESINTKCPFMSITCESYETFKKGKCAQCNRDGNFCIRFGFHSRKDYQRVIEKGNFDGSPIATYLLTTDKEPFCAAHYKVTVKVSGKDGTNSLIITRHEQKTLSRFLTRRTKTDSYLDEGEACEQIYILI